MENDETQEQLKTLKRDARQLVLLKNILSYLLLFTVGVGAYFFIDFSGLGIDDPKTIVTVVLAAGGLIYPIHTAIAPRLLDIRSKNWPFTTCKIVSKEVEHDTVFTPNRFRPYLPIIYFSFIANGESHLVQQIWRKSFYNEQDAWKATNPYQVGASYICLYNPNDPEEAILGDPFAERSQIPNNGEAS